MVLSVDHNAQGRRRYRQVPSEILREDVLRVMAQFECVGRPYMTDMIKLDRKGFRLSALHEKAHTHDSGPFQRKTCGEILENTQTLNVSTTL